MTRHHPTRRLARPLAEMSLVPLTTNRGARGLEAGPQGARDGAGESRPALFVRRPGATQTWRRVAPAGEAVPGGGCRVSWAAATAPPPRLPERDGRGASALSRAMDESGELGGLETMETLTELGDELTLGDIDGEWLVGGWECGGRAGRKGLRRRARVRVRPPPGSPGSRGKNPVRTVPPAVPNPSGAASLSPAQPRRSGRPWDLGRRGAESGARVAGSRARGQGRRGGVSGSGLRRARGCRLPRAPTRALRGPLSRRPRPCVAPVTPCPDAGAALGFPGPSPQSRRPESLGFSGLIDGQVAGCSAKLWAATAEASC